MSLSAEDRVALLLGRAIHRAEALQVRVEQLEEGNRVLREEITSIKVDLENLGSPHDPLPLP